MPNYKECAAVYLRKSRMDPDSESIDETLARHMDTLVKLAARCDFNITNIYKEVVSGDGLFTRPQMLQMLRDIERGEITSVLCMEIDRLGRSSQKDSGIIFETLKDRDVRIVTPNKTYDLNDDIDEQSVEMQSFIARQELKSIKRRLRKGTEKSCEYGYHISEPPYGYRRVYVDRHPTLEIVEEEADVVRMVFDWYVNKGLGSCSIADKLNSMGYMTRKKNKFSRTSVGFFLRNVTYTGKIIWNKERHIRPKFEGDKHRLIPNPEEKWIVSDGIHPAIISQEMFDMAQRIRKTRSHPPSFTGTLANPFAGLIHCSVCGGAMQRQYSPRSGARLLCTSTGCQRSVKAVYVEDYVMRVLGRVFADCKPLLLKEAPSETERQSEMVKGMIRSLEKNRKSIVSQRDGLYELLEQGIYDATTFKERNAVLSGRLESVDKSISEQRAALEMLAAHRDEKKTVTAPETLTDSYAKLEPAEKNRLLKRLIRRIEYTHAKDWNGSEFSLSFEWNCAL